MKLVVVADIHGREDAAELINSVEGDLLVVCGDITHMGRPENFEISFIKDLKFKKIFAVPGNCDPQSVLKNLEKLGVSIHKRNVVYEGITFSGLGGADPDSFNLGVVFNERDVKNMSGDVWVLHQPPYMHLDLAGYRHAGNQWITTHLLRKKPILVLSGHIHEARGVEEGETTFINPGPLRDGYYAIVELSGKKVKNVELLRI